MQTRKQEILDLLWYHPVEIGHWVGFRDLTELHNEWLRKFLFEDNDQTLQAHRGSYKTTTLSLFFALNSIIHPYETMLFFRKTDTDVQEVIRQTENILATGCVRRIAHDLYGKQFYLVTAKNNELQNNLGQSVKGTSQLLGLGLGTSITGKHADIVITDDIISIKDRVSGAERRKTRIAYQELQNVKNRGGRFINTGTPWHKEDAFTMMPNLSRYDCYSTGLMTNDEIRDIRNKMSPSLFAANYELKHIADEGVIFPEVPIGANPEYIKNGICQVDSAYGGSDYTAFTIMTYIDKRYYIFGKLWHKHVEDCYTEILSLYNQFLCGKLYTEKNADKGMVARDLKNMGMRVVPYDENMNKHVKISTYLKAIWQDVVFVEGTDYEYISQIEDYTEDAEHDDAPDSAAVLARYFYKKYGRKERDYTRPLER